MGNFVFSSHLPTRKQATSCARIFLLIFSSLFSFSIRVEFLLSQAVKEHFQWICLSENIYAAVAREKGDASVNCGIVITDQWACVFDSSQSTEAAEEIKSFIQRRTPVPIRYLINSQYRGNHTHGNQVISSGPMEIFSSRQTRIDMTNKDLPQLQRYQQILPDSIERLQKEIKGATQDVQTAELQAEITRREKMLRRLNSIRLTLPTVTFDTSMSLYSGDTEIQISYPGKGSTEGNTVLWISDPRILFAGHLVFSRSIPDLEDASTRDWIDTLSTLQKLKPEIVLPSGGAVADAEILEETKQYLLTLRKTVRMHYERGETLETVLQNCPLPEKYKEHRDTDYYPHNLEKVYREIQEESLLPKPTATVPPKKTEE